MFRVSRLIESIEQRNLSVSVLAATFIAIVIIRNQLENALEKAHSIATGASFYHNLVDLFHVAASWLSLLLVMTIILSLVLNVAINRVTNVVLAIFPLVISVPVIDALFHKAGSISYQYDFSKFTASFINLFNPFATVDYVTFGVRLEIVAVVALTVIYAAHHSRGSARYYKPALLAVAVYGTIFLVGFLPAVWSWLFSLSSEEMLRRSVLQVTFVKAQLLWYLPILPVAAFYCHLKSPACTKALLSAVRPSRLGVYLLLLNFGFISATFKGLVDYDWLNPLDVGLLLLANAAIVTAFIAQVVLNDWYDQSIDRIANSSRPLVAGELQPGSYRMIGTACALFSLLASIVVHDIAFTLILFIHAIGFVYSAPPFRLRQWPFVSPLLLAAIAVSVFIYGSALIHGNQVMLQVNLSIIAVSATLFFIGANFKDIKDEQGDRLNGVITLATMLGGRAAYWLTGAVMITACSCFLLTGAIKSSLPGWGALAIFVAGLLLARKSENIFWYMIVSVSIILYQLL